MNGGSREPDDDRPVYATDDGFVVNLTIDEREMVGRLLGELREMVADERPSDEVAALLTRLFPPASTGDEAADVEYQRLMRSELVASKLAAFDVVERVLNADTPEIDEPELVAFMQSVNSVRLVLGVMLQVSDEPNAPEVMPGFENSKEYHLYGYLSWLLEWTVQALSDS